MRESRLFTVCLVISLTAHTGLFFVPPFRLNFQKAKKHTPIEVSYQKSKALREEGLNTEYLDKQSEQNNPPKTQPENTPESLLLNTKDVQDFIKNEIFKKREDISLAREPSNDKADSQVKKSVQTPNIPGQTFKTPEYKSYYGLIREKIRKYAYYNYKKLLEGEVFMNFSLSSNGKIMDIDIDEQKSTEHLYLRKIAIKSIKSAAPFPEFPPKLQKYKKLSFNVIISFELK